MTEPMAQEAIVDPSALLRILSPERRWPMVLWVPSVMDTLIARSGEHGPYERVLDNLAWHYGESGRRRENDWGRIRRHYSEWKESGLLRVVPRQEGLEAGIEALDPTFQNPWLITHFSPRRNILAEIVAETLVFAARTQKCVLNGSRVFLSDVQERLGAFELAAGARFREIEANLDVTIEDLSEEHERLLRAAMGLRHDVDLLRRRKQEFGQLVSGIKPNSHLVWIVGVVSLAAPHVLGIQPPNWLGALLLAMDP